MYFIRKQLPQVVVEQSIIPMPPGSLCEQVSRYATAHIVVTVHGAHVTLASLMTPGQSLLLEVMPFSTYEFKFSSAVTAPIGIKYMQLCGMYETGMDNELDVEGQVKGSQKNLNCYKTRSHTHATQPKCTVKSNKCDCTEGVVSKALAYFLPGSRRAVTPPIWHGRHPTKKPTRVKKRVVKKKATPSKPKPSDPKHKPKPSNPKPHPKPTKPMPKAKG